MINIKNKIFIALLVAALGLSIVACGSESDISENKVENTVGEAIEDALVTEVVPEFMGGYSFGMTRSEGANIEKPTMLYNRPLASVTPMYDDVANEIHAIYYDFDAGVKLDSILDKIIDAMGTYADYEPMDHKGFDGEYSQESYYWYDDNYSVELRYTEYIWDRVESREKVLSLYIWDRTYNPGKPYSMSE